MSKIYRVTEFAKRIGKSARTLRRWDAKGVFLAKRHPSGHRYYDESDVRKVFGETSEPRHIVVYCRVSGANQKDDLSSQINAMEQFCLHAGIAVDEWISEIGGGMNFKRKRFLRLMDDIQQGKISKLIIAHKDRLCRFGFEYFEHMARDCGCEIVVVNHESLSPQKEMVEDLLSIIHTFSCRLYGLRRYTKILKNDFAKTKATSLYPNTLKIWDFRFAKDPGFNDRKPVNIRNMDRFTIVESRDLWLCGKPNFECVWV